MTHPHIPTLIQSYNPSNQINDQSVPWILNLILYNLTVFRGSAHDDVMMKRRPRQKEIEPPNLRATVN